MCGKGGAWVVAGMDMDILSVVGHITWCTDKTSVDKILGDQMPVKIARGGGQNAVHFMGQGGQNAYLNKTLYI